MPSGIRIDDSDVRLLQQTFRDFTEWNRRDTDLLFQDQSRRLAVDLFNETKKVAPTAAEIEADVKARGWHIPKYFHFGGTRGWRTERGKIELWSGLRRPNQKRKHRKMKDATYLARNATLVWDWITKGVEDGSIRIEKAYEREGQARKKAKAAADADEKKSKHGKHGGGGGENLGMGVHDLLMGRTSAAMFRFAHALKLGATAGAALNILTEKGGQAIDYVRDRLEATEKASERLEQSFQKLNRSATFSSAAEDPGKLLETRNSLLDGIKEERAGAFEAGQTQDVIDSKSWLHPDGRSQTAGPGIPVGNGFGGWVFRQYDHWNKLKTGLSNKDRIHEMQMREDIYGKEQAKVGREYHTSLGEVRDIAVDRARGNTFEAQRKENSRKERLEITTAIGLTGENKKLIQDRYAAQRQAIDREERVAKGRLDTEKAIARLRQGGADVEMGSAQARFHEAWDQLNDPTVQAAGKDSMVYHQAQNAVTERSADLSKVEFSRSQESYSSAGQTAAARFALYGRDDIAGLATSRVQSTNEAAAYRRDGRDDQADDVEERQQIREQQARVSKYLNPDGTMRNPGDVLREDIEKQRRTNRIDAFLHGTKDADPGGGLSSGGLLDPSGLYSDAGWQLKTDANDLTHSPAMRLANARKGGFRGGPSALDGHAEKVGDLGGLGLLGIRRGMDGSLLDARDALTGQHLNAQQIHDRQAQAKKDQEREAKGPHTQAETFRKIWEVLDERLPKAP